MVGIAVNSSQGRRIALIIVPAPAVLDLSAASSLAGSRGGGSVQEHKPAQADRPARATRRGYTRGGRAHRQSDAEVAQDQRLHRPAQRPGCLPRSKYRPCLREALTPALLPVCPTE